jgi:hypothetical protein
MEVDWLTEPDKDDDVEIVDETDTDGDDDKDVV